MEHQRHSLDDILLAHDLVLFDTGVLYDNCRLSRGYDATKIASEIRFLQELNHKCEYYGNAYITQGVYNELQGEIYRLAQDSKTIKVRYEYSKLLSSLPRLSPVEVPISSGFASDPDRELVWQILDVHARDKQRICVITTDSDISHYFANVLRSFPEDLAWNICADLSIFQRHRDNKGTHPFRRFFYDPLRRDVQCASFRDGDLAPLRERPIIQHPLLEHTQTKKRLMLYLDRTRRANYLTALDDSGKVRLVNLEKLEQNPESLPLRTFPVVIRNDGIGLPSHLYLAVPDIQYSATRYVLLSRLHVKIAA